MTAVEDRRTMGTPEEARENLLRRAREWREARMPYIATAAQHKERDRVEHDLRFELANAALVWLWHEENPER